MSRHPNARFNLGCGVQDLALIDDEIRVTTPKGEFALDFLIFSTGFRIDWTARPEFAALAPHVRAWGDRYTPAAGDEDQELHDSPTWAPPSSCRKIARRLSRAGPRALLLVPGRADTRHGVGRHPAISEGAKRLAQGIAGLFYREDVAAHYANMEAFSEPEVFGDEWTPAPPPSAVSAQPATAAAPTQARTHTAPATAATETAK